MKAPEIEKILSQKNVSQVEFGNAGKNLSVETKEKIEKAGGKVELYTY